MSLPLARLAASALTATLALAPGAPSSLAPNTPPVAARNSIPAMRERARTALLAADAALAERVARDGWAAGLEASIAEDALYLQPGEPLVRGRAAVEAVLARTPEAGARLRLRDVLAGLSDDGTLGYTSGAIAEESEKGPKHGRWLAAWRATANGYRVAALVRMEVRTAFGPPPEGSPLARGYAGAPRPGEPGALARAAFDADRAFAAKAREVSAASGYGPAFAAFADPAAMVATSAGPLWGAQAIAAGYRTEPGEALEWAPEHGEAAASGDLAWTSGRAEWRGGGERAFTKYLTIWARQPDGAWRWLLDAGNGSPASP